MAPRAQGRARTPTYGARMRGNRGTDRRRQKNMRSIRIPLVLLAVTILASCGTDPDAGSDATVPPSSPSTSTTSTTEGTTTSTTSAVDGVPVDAAIALLAEQLGVPADEISVALAEQITWNDGALGCPEPGMSYTQALVPGYRILLEVGGDTYAVHGADGGDPFLCDEPTATGDAKQRP